MCVLIAVFWWLLRSIGDYAVKDVGVIPEPEVKELTITAEDNFIIISSDGVWEFISSQVISLHLVRL
jgi:serine/threonine protein phosphatase PrpC